MLGTKEDFELIRQQINIEAVANHLMKKQGKNYIFPSEKSASVRIYPETQSFYDFGRCTGGDVIRLWSHVRDVDSWTALCQMRACLSPLIGIGEQYGVTSLIVVHTNKKQGV